MAKTKQAQKKQETRRRMLEAVGRGFRRRGYTGAGVDGLAKDAGVTSGAFYAHFGSKSGAFREALMAGMSQLTEAIVAARERDGDQWLGSFAEFYMGERRTCELAEGCALQTLTPEVGRADEPTRALFREELLKTVAAFAAGLPDGEGHPDTDRAWAFLALLSGGVTLARAVEDPELGERIARAIQAAVQDLGGVR